MTDSRSWLSRANDYAAIAMQRLGDKEPTWDQVYEAIRGAYLQGAVDQYNALENEWSEEHPNPIAEVRSAIRHRS